MKLIVAISVSLLLASASQATAQYRCHHDPVCQAKRDGISVQEARRRDAGGPSNGAECRARAGFTLEQWSAGQTTKSQRRAWDRCMGRR